jgi:hypothetical protein
VVVVTVRKDTRQGKQGLGDDRSAVVSSGDDSRRVWKFAVPSPTTTGRAFIDVPVGTVLISAGMQGDDMYVWGLVQQDSPLELRRLIVANTGMDVPGFPLGAQFLGRVTNIGIVWHVWDGDADDTTGDRAPAVASEKDVSA